MWPTTETPILLFLGLFPVSYALFRQRKVGLSGLTQLSVVGALIYWIGYHLSPWIAYLTGEPWQSFLLVDSRIDESLKCSGFFMASYVLGCTLYERRAKHLLNRDQGSLNEITLVLMAIAVDVLYFWAVGGSSEMWRASNVRGYGQFDLRESGSLPQTAIVISGVASVPLAALASTYILSSRKSLDRILAGVFALFASGLPQMWGFSRAAGMPFAIFGIVALKLHGWRGMRWAAVAFAIAWFLGQAGLTGRQYYNPGLANFAEALFASDDVIESNSQQIDIREYPNINPLEAVTAWTRKAEQTDLELPERGAMIVNYLFNLLPLPSEVIALRPIGADLSVVMGTVGSVGITTPSFAETYYVFGLAGGILFGVFGWAVAAIERHSDLETPAMKHFVWILAMSSFPVGLHSNTRAMTRPIVYALLILLLSRTSRRLTAGRIRKGGVPLQSDLDGRHTARSN